MADAKSELYELRRIGATPQKNSGRGAFQKGDGKLDDVFVADVKESAKSFSFNRAVWAKIEQDSLKHRMRPLLKIVLGDDPATKMRIVAIDEEMFLELYEAYRKVNSDEG